MLWSARESFPYWFIRAHERLTHATAAQQMTWAEWRGRLTVLGYELTDWQQWRRAA